MNAPTSLPKRPSLVERAAEVYDFGEAFRRREGVVAEAPLPGEPRSLGTAPPPLVENTYPVENRSTGVRVDQARLAEGGFILPGAPAGALVEELRVVKRGLLAAARAAGSGRGQVVLVTSANAGEGKSFTAINLAISLAGEHATEVLLVDGDMLKPSVLSSLGLAGERGLMDAIEQGHDPESLVLRTDIRGLSVLPPGSAANTVTELLSSPRTADVFAALTRDRPDRIVIVDSPPVLAASPTSVLAAHAGQILLVVRADQTSEADLRESVQLLGTGADIKLVLNAVSSLVGGRRLGNYYGVAR